MKQPSEKDLAWVETCEIITQNDVIEYLHELATLWQWGEDDGFFDLKGKRVLRLELHTGGWSGNEDIIDAMQRNIYFWTRFWLKTERGGHYYFRIRLGGLKP